MYLFAILSWFKFDKIPISYTFVALFILIFVLLLQFFLEKRTQDEMSKLQEQVTELHKIGTAQSSFELFLKNKKIGQDKKVIETESLNKNIPFVLTLKNIGDAESENLQVHLWIPENIKNVRLGKHWKNVGAPIFKQKKLKV